MKKTVTKKATKKNSNGNGEKSKLRVKLFNRFKDQVLERVEKGEKLSSINADLAKAGAQPHFANYILLKLGKKKMSPTSREYRQIKNDFGISLVPKPLGTSKSAKSKPKKSTKKSTTK